MFCSWKMKLNGEAIHDKRQLLKEGPTGAAAIGKRSQSYLSFQEMAKIGSSAPS